jgi:hypothetical protein
MEQKGTIRGHLIFVFENSESVALSDVPNNADSDRIYPDTHMDFGVTATPTLLIVDRTGKISHAWQGVLAPREEEAVVDLVR